MGCATKRDGYDVPSLALPKQFHQAPATIAPDSSGSGSALALDDILNEWWRVLGNAELDRLMQRALAANPDLRIANLRLAQAQARAGQARADEFPGITVPLRVSAEAPESGVGAVPPGGNVKTEKSVEISLRADWRVDLWGERRSLAEASERRVWRASFQRDDTQRRLLADVASAYLEYLSLNDRLKVAHENEGVLQAMLAGMATRLDHGEATVTEVAQQRTSVHAVRATIPAIELQREEVLNRLGLLVGALPGELVLSDQGLASLQLPRVHPGVPSSLLLRRPDVRAAEAELLAADADIDVARARVLPTLDLSAQVGYGSRHFAQLFQPHTLFWEWVANLSASIFDHGRREQEVAFSRALHEELTEQYLRVVYHAVRETEDALAAMRMTERRIEAQHAAMLAAREAWGYSQEAYAAGAIDYLTLLDTQRTYHQQLDTWHGLRLERQRALVNLFRSLGGGIVPTGPLPGVGARPVASPGGGLILAQATALQPVQGLDWQGSSLSAGDRVWLVEFAGVHDRAGASAAWRELQRAFPLATTGRQALPRVLVRVDTRRKDGADLYRLFVGSFSERAAADAFCAEVRDNSRSCRVVAAGSREFKQPQLSAVSPGAGKRH